MSTDPFSACFREATGNKSTIDTQDEWCVAPERPNGRAVRTVATQAQVYGCVAP